MWRVQEQAVAEVRAGARVNDDRPPRPIAEVTSAVAAMKLVTVQIDTKVRVQRGEESWRGGVRAAIEMPVRLSYGVNLAGLDVSRLGWSPVAMAYVITLPAPTRIATQLMGERVPAELEVGWLRLRSRAGEYYISQARKDAPGAAMALELLPADAERVELTTRNQVRALVRSLVGQDVSVVVRFVEGVGDSLAAGDGGGGVEEGR